MVHGARQWPIGPASLKLAYHVTLLLLVHGRSMASRVSMHVSPTPIIFRYFAPRPGSSGKLFLQTGRNDTFATRPIPGLQKSHLSHSEFLSTLLRTRPNQRYRCYSDTSAPAAPMTEPSRGDLFYHVLPPPTPISSSLPAFGVSFLNKPPHSADSCAIIGWLPAVSEGEGQEAGLNDFKENRESNLTMI